MDAGGRDECPTGESTVRLTHADEMRTAVERGCVYRSGE